MSRLRSEETRHINENICINSNVKYMNVWILHNAILTNTNFSLSGLFSSRLKHRSLAVVRSLLLFQPCDKSFILTLSLVRYNVLYWALPEYQIWCTNKSWQRSIRSCKITAHAQFNYLPFFFCLLRFLISFPYLGTWISSFCVDVIDPKHAIANCAKKKKRNEERKEEN